MEKIAIFASGSGTNAENIIQFFSKSSTIKVALIVTNNPNAFVLERAKKLGVKSFIFNKSDFSESNKILQKLHENDINWIVLAGFLLKIPEKIIKSYPKKIINIHPALLPKFGGKGMFGNNVHQAVINNNEKESGITIHYVNDHYDEGEIIFQAKCDVTSVDTPSSLAKKIHSLEYEHFPAIIAQVLS